MSKFLLFFFFKCEGNLIIDFKVIVDSFCKYFINIGLSFVSVILVVNFNFCLFFINNNNNFIILKLIIIIEFENIFKILVFGKVFGYDNILMYVIKSFFYLILLFLVIIIN